MMDTGEGAAYITWNTTEDGTIVISISGVEGDPDAAFRNVGMRVASFTVNGQRGTWFDLALDEAMTTITLTPLVDLIPGDKVGYADVVEYKTSLNADLWPTLSFRIHLRQQLRHRPESEPFHLDPPLHADRRQAGVLPLRGESDRAVTLAAPKGITVSPDTIQPDENGVMEETAVAVLWDGGSSAGRHNHHLRRRAGLAAGNRPDVRRLLRILQPGDYAS